MNATTSTAPLPERRYRGDYVPLDRRGTDYRTQLFYLRRGLFVLASIMLLYVAVKSNFNNLEWESLPEEIAPDDVSISVRNARYAGLDAGKLPFSITADEIVQDKANPEELRMIAPQADITLNNGQWIYMSANQALIEPTGSRILIEDNVNINFSDGYELNTDNARMNMRLGIILGDSDVKMQGVNFNFASAGFRIHNSGQNIALLGPADLQLHRNGSPLEVSAKSGLEWQRDKERYSAEGSVRVANASIVLHSDELEMFYETENTESGQEQVVTLIKAYHNVRLETSGGIIYADSAIYDVPRNVVSFLGDDIYLDSPEAQLNASNSLEYWSETEIAIARGKAEVKAKGSRSLSAETIRAKISLLNGTKQISYATAEGDVSINTGESLIIGSDGNYDFTTQQGRICGGLKIIEKDNILRGECATIDMQTGVSQIENSGADRVQGTFGTQ